MDQIELTTGHHSNLAGQSTCDGSPQSGVGTNAKFCYSTGLTMSSDGTQLFLAATYDNMIMQIDIATRSVIFVAAAPTLPTCAPAA